MGLEPQMPRSDAILPLLEESLDVSKRTVGKSRVRVETRTDFVQELAAADLEGSEVEVTRVPVERLVTEAPPVRTEGDLTIIPVLEEVLVVEKRLRLKEELHVRRRMTIERVEVPVQLRKQTAVITRTNNPDQSTNED